MGGTVVVKPALTRDAVEAAAAEYDGLGQAAFLATYGFKPAKGYLLRIGEKTYDSKAIVGVAYKFLPGGEPMPAGAFSGGADDAVAKLKALGFDVDGPDDDVDWSWEEHVLALHFYVSHPLAMPGKGSAQVLELSGLLNALAERRQIPRSPKFRNANGVYMKLMNFRRLDPKVQAEGKKGLQRGAKGEEAVWAQFANDLPALAEAAAAIRLAVEDVSVALADSEEPYEASEGAVVLRLHRSRERDRKLIETKKAKVLKQLGTLACEVCDFDFSAAYGAVGTGFIEAHHTKPVSKLVAGDKTTLSDLALVCANCHRMLHRSASLLTIDALRALRTQHALTETQVGES